VTKSVYDTDDYYAANSSGSRLSPAFDGLLRIFDRGRARAVLKTTGLSSGKVLDVGAGDGKFLHFLQRRGFQVRGTGCDWMCRKPWINRSPTHPLTS
jgi:2-polyprenyl-3-methyl-5-hydroxy-6-metoxy-1,4-benzoquinol methylase